LSPFSIDPFTAGAGSTVTAIAVPEPSAIHRSEVFCGALYSALYSALATPSLWKMMGSAD